MYPLINVQAENIYKISLYSVRDVVKNESK